jgi:hypothetical protein
MRESDDIFKMPGHLHHFHPVLHQSVIPRPGYKQCRPNGELQVYPLT